MELRESPELFLVLTHYPPAVFLRSKVCFTFLLKSQEFVLLYFAAVVCALFARLIGCFIKTKPEEMKQQLYVGG